VEAAGWRANNAAPLPALAQWWLRRIGHGDALEILQSRPLANWQEELRAIRGVNWELADRILLVVGDFPVYPIDRGSLRIAARHGWMEITAEYDDWQEFFVGSLRDSNIKLAQFAEWNMRAGRDFCGTRPKCDDCPLKSLLPARGPVQLAEE
jgi:endonuclease-3 related protein